MPHKKDRSKQHQIPKTMLDGSLIVKILSVKLKHRSHGKKYYSRRICKPNIG